VADRIVHVGSMSVPGLAAKPIIDMTIVVRQRATWRGRSIISPRAANR